MDSHYTFDLHTHHERCNHAVGNIRDYVEVAINKGLDIIGISDHSPHFYSEEEQLYPSKTMGKSEFPHYIKEVLKLKDEYENQIELLLSVEADFLPEYVKLYQKEFDRYPFDYIIGSVHVVNGISIFDKSRWKDLTKKQIVETKESYYTLIHKSAACGLYQVLGHIDAMKGYYPEFETVQTEAVEFTLKEIAKYDIAIEVNTSGKTKDCGGWYPSYDILEKALYYGVDVTFGSDAHTPERVGEDLFLVQNTLKEIGYNKWCFFRKKQKEYVSLYS